MGFKFVKKEVVARLRSGDIQHEIGRSGEINIKNFLLTGQISVEEVIDIINKTKGFQYQVTTSLY